MNLNVSGFTTLNNKFTLISSLNISGVADLPFCNYNIQFIESKWIYNFKYHYKIFMLLLHDLKVLHAYNLDVIQDIQKGTKLHFKSPTAERRHVLCVGVGRN